MLKAHRITSQSAEGSQTGPLTRQISGFVTIMPIIACKNLPCRKCHLSAVVPQLQWHVVQLCFFNSAGSSIMNPFHSQVQVQASMQPECNWNVFA